MSITGQVQATIRYLFAAIAGLAALSLPLTVLNLTQSVGLKRLRPATAIVFLALSVFIMARRNPGRYWRELTARAVRILSGRRFFPVMALVMLALYVATAVTRHLAFETFSHDFSIMDEAIAGIRPGSFMFTSMFGRSLLSEHFYALLIPLIPLRSLVPSPWLLILLQPVVMWASVFFLRRLLLNSGLSVAAVNLACLAWLNNPFMVRTLNYLVHPEVALPLLSLAMFWHYRRENWFSFWAVLSLALLVKEDVGLYLTGFAAWVAIAEKRRGLGFLIAAVSVAYVLLIIKVVIPSWGIGVNEYQFQNRWAVWGSSPSGILVGMLTHPLDLLMSLIGGRQLLMMASLLSCRFSRRGAGLYFSSPGLSTAQAFITSSMISRLIMGFRCFP